ncbi:MAG: tRNA (adenosine(37)-N6)-threonylcarbamoyltransferase complex dimerization subunit type 1 TsaB [Thermotogota bacterium]
MSSKRTKKHLSLFLDAATPFFYIAIKELESGVVIERHYDHSELKGEALLSIVKGIFEERDYDVNDIAYLCTTKGPGSLTGLRIAMSIVKTMAQILNIPIVCIPTLFALERSYVIERNTHHNRVMTCLTARKNCFYVRCSGNNDDGFKQLSSETLCQAVKNVTIVLWAEGCVPFEGCDKRNVNFVIVKLSPEVIFELCEEKYHKREYFNYLDCRPEYAGKSVAEKNFENK